MEGGNKQYTLEFHIQLIMVSAWYAVTAYSKAVCGQIQIYPTSATSCVKELYA
jgi:hypothetical protein